MIVALQGEIYKSGFEKLKKDLGEKLAACSDCKGVLIDISSVSVVDSTLEGYIRTMILTSQLMGVKAVLAGMRPEAALTLTALDLNMKGIATAINVEKGISMLNG